MSAGRVDLTIDQGEDWTVNVIWTDDNDEPVVVTFPCRMDIRASTGQTVATLETDPDLPDGEVPSIGLSEELGLVQLHLTATQTAAIPPGIYDYDLFVTTNDDDSYAGAQANRLIAGTVFVNKRFTRL